MRHLSWLAATAAVLLGGVEASAGEAVDDSAASGARAAHASWDEFTKANRFECPGPFETLEEPRTIELGGKKYLHEGFRMVVRDPDKDNRVTIGVLSAIKDVSEPTKANLREAFAWFRTNGAEWIVVNGDLALQEFDLEDVVTLLGEQGLPALLVLGNSESKGSFARVYRERMEQYPNLINGVWVRQIIADDAEFWTLPGYYDRRFAHQSATCAYGEKHVEAMEDELVPSGQAPVVLVSHGPPRCRGRRVIDRIADGKNVGDPLLTELMRKKKIRFGLFGHILEAGGLAVGRKLARPVPPNRPQPFLYVNAGSVSADPWALNTGKTSYGMAMLFVLNGRRASYQLKRFPPRAE